jgi:hypothetical protein
MMQGTMNVKMLPSFYILEESVVSIFMIESGSVGCRGELDGGIFVRWIGNKIGSVHQSVTLRRFRTTIVAAEKQKVLRILSV